MADTDEARKLIEDRQHDQAAMLVQIFDDTIAQDGCDLSTALAATLHALAEDWRTQARLWEVAKRKGWQSTQKELLLVAARVAGVAAQVGKVDVQIDRLVKKIDLSALGTTPTETERRLAGNPGLVAQIEQTFAAGETVDRLLNTDFSAPFSTTFAAGEHDIEHGAVVQAESLGDVRPQLDDVIYAQQADVVEMSEQREYDDRDDIARTEAYLRGESDSLSAGPSSTPSVAGEGIAGVADPTPGTSELNREAKAMTMTFADPGAPMFADPDVPDWEPFKGAGNLRMTFADLMRPVAPSLVPGHLSHSQIEDLEGCGVKYRLGRLEGLPRIPSWSLLGGDVFHQCAAYIEGAIASPGSSWPDAHAVDTLWNETFEKVVAERRAASPVPFDRWYVSNKGKEGYDWWRIEGAIMLGRYVAMRRAQHVGRELVRAPMIIGDQHSSLVLELEVSTFVHGPSGNVPFVSILDQAWNLGEVGILIVDLKTGSRMPVDTFQLATQAFTLMSNWRSPSGESGWPLVSGSYYDARKATFTEPVDLFKAHTYDEFAYRVHTAAMKRNMGLFAPKRDTMCTACGVKYACPAFSR